MGTLNTILAAALSLCCGAFMALFLRAFEREAYRRAVWLKGLASLCFVTLGLLFCRISGDRFSKLVLGGLHLGLLGDVLLALRYVYAQRHDPLFLAGALSFAVGHALYLTALFGSGAPAWGVTLAFLAMGLAASAVYSKKRRVDAGRFQAAGMGYIALVVFLAAVACAVAVRRGSVGALLFALGGVNFAVSDNLLCAYCYGSARRTSVNWAVHVTYYAAQLLIAWSILWI